MRPALPLLTPENRPFWTGGERGQLLILRCTSCGAWLHPPVPVCRHCLSLAVEPVAVSGRGRLLTWTVNHQQWLPDLPVPYVLVVVELEEDPVLRVVSRLVDADPDRVQIGMTVEVAFEQHDDVWLPMFRLTGVG